MEQLKDVVRRLRRERKLSQAKLAIEADVSPSSVYRLEAGKAPEEGDATEKVLKYLGVDPGHFQSGPLSTERQNKPNLPSNMGQMIGRMQLPAGVEDYYTTIMEIALEREAPDAVFRDLAKARNEAPPDAGMGWWFRRYLDAVERAGTSK